MNTHDSFEALSKRTIELEEQLANTKTFAAEILTQRDVARADIKALTNLIVKMSDDINRIQCERDELLVKIARRNDVLADVERAAAREAMLSAAVQWGARADRATHKLARFRYFEIMDAFIHERDKY